MNEVNYYYFFLAASGGFLFGHLVRAVFAKVLEAVDTTTFSDLTVEVRNGRATINVSLPGGVKPDDARQVAAAEAFALQDRLRPCECCGAIDGEHYSDEDGDACPLDFGAPAFMECEGCADCEDEEDDHPEDKPN